MGESMIIGISGLVFDEQGNKGSAGAGKSTVADRLVARHKFVAVGLADVMKRFVQEVLGFSDEQLWGPSEKRNEPDKRFSRRLRPFPPGTERAVAAIQKFVEAMPYLDSTEHAVKEISERLTEFLTPRYALQALGTEWGRHCYEDMWVAYAMKVAQKLILQDVTYRARYGVCYTSGEVKGVVFSDLRFKNEIDYIKKNGGKIVRVRRPVEKFIASEHQSEMDLNDVPDDAFDYVIHGLPADVHDLQLKTDQMLDWFKGRIIPYDEKSVDVPPFLRKGAVLPLGTGILVEENVTVADSVELKLTSSLGSSPPFEGTISDGGQVDLDAQHYLPIISVSGKDIRCCPLDTDNDGSCPIHPKGCD